MYFGSRLKKVFMPDESGRHNPLKTWLVKEEGCGAIADFLDDEQVRLKELVDRKHPPRVEGRLKATHLATHYIDVQGHPPIKQRYRVVSPKAQEAIYEEIDRMLAEGVIKESFSKWSTPIVMAKKANGGYRFCLDFRKLNTVSKKDAYPIPYMSDILKQLKVSKYISTIDLSCAFNQIPLDEACQEYTTFTVPSRGLFQFVRMPFGLWNALATFQRLIDRVIGPELRPHAFFYLDDIIVVTETFEEH